MNQYEIMYVIDAALEDSARTELISRFADLVVKNGGEVQRIDEWGKRRLAYAINYKTEGYYVLMYVKAPAEAPREIERNMKINENVLRYMTIRYEGDLPAKREPLKPYAPREAVPAASTEETVPAEEAAPVEEAAPAEETAPVEEAAPAEEAVPAEEAADDENPVSEAE